MKPNDIIAALRQVAQQSEDAAQACEAIARHHRPAYEAAVHTPPPQATPALHQRALDLYPHVIINEQEARRLREEAELFLAAADWIDEACAKL